MNNDQRTCFVLFFRSNLGENGKGKNFMRYLYFCLEQLPMLFLFFKRRGGEAGKGPSRGGRTVGSVFGRLLFCVTCCADTVGSAAGVSCCIDLNGCRCYVLVPQMTATVFFLMDVVALH